MHVADGRYTCIREQSGLTVLRKHAIRCELIKKQELVLATAKCVKQSL